MDSTSLFSDNTNTQYITFWIGEELFGVKMEVVQEVISWTEITKVYKAAPYILGVINLRGQIVTIMDIPTKLFEDSEYAQQYHRDYTKIIILNLKNEQIGIAVKDVGEVTEAESSDLGEVPSNIPEMARPYFVGILRKSDKTISILNLEVMFHA
ncbi:MAG: chemotaxis protein CheW [Syntrophobacterales bacterium]|nr:chemotaxis protein CheW [Syntrophobacterales bacterium]